MGGLAVALGLVAVLLGIQLYRYRQQIAAWTYFLEETDENSNMRLGSRVRSRVCLRFCEQINERLEKAQAARIGQEQRQREWKQTIACLSHDIRTPLTGALGYLQLLEETGEEEKQRAYRAVVRRRLGDLNGLLEELFLYTRLINEEYRPACEMMRAGQVLCQTLADFYGELDKAKIEPAVLLPEEEKPVYASPEALRRVFENLLKNALLYGGGSLRIEQKEKSIAFTNNIGDGPEPDVRRIFEPFYRADVSRHTRGTGLGLAGVKGLMERMGGGVGAKWDPKRRELTIVVMFSL